MLAWCFARSAGGRFLVRMEDLTTGAAPVAESSQLADLEVLGLGHDGPVVRQSERRELHEEALDRLVATGRTYECFCSRREIREAAAAPHGPSAEGAYPGTCRGLTARQRADRRADGRLPALRLRAGGTRVVVEDRRLGTAAVVVDDDPVLRRADGVVAYHLAVVVDDADQGVDEVVRGDDLWHATPTQALLQDLLGLTRPGYVHVPLVLGPDGARLAKRHGAVTLADRAALGESPAATLGVIAASLGLAVPGEEVDAATVLDRFRPDRLPLGPWVLEG